MNSKSKRLLDALLEEAAPADFQAALMNETLRQMRRRCRVQACNRGLFLATLLVGLPVLIWRAFVFEPRSPAPTHMEAHRPAQPSYHMVRSQPVDLVKIVETKPGLVRIVSSVPTEVAIVQTNPGDHLFKALTDEQLFALLLGRPAALVRYSPHETELLFLNPGDENGFPVQ